MAVEAMLKGQEEERSRLAKDLHDGLGGMLSGVKISFSNMKENMIMDANNLAVFERSISQLDNTIEELRKVSHNLMPEALVKFGLKSAVKDFCGSIQVHSKTKIICEQLGSERELGNKGDVTVYRIIQELVNNALKYAQAGQILVQLTKTPNKVMITVEDDGKGFDAATLEKSPGIGLANIKHRVNYLNGTIEIHSKPGDDHPMVIEGLQVLLQNEKDISVIGTSNTAAGCLDYFAHHKADIILMDINLPDMNGVDLCKTIKTTYKEIMVLALSTINQGIYMNKMMENGASGYLLKNLTGKELIEAIKTANKGGIYFSFEAGKIYKTTLEKSSHLPVLTKREKEIVKLIAEGLTNGEISKRLFISIDTVDSHRKNLHTKLNVKNTASLIRYAIENGIVSYS